MISLALDFTGRFWIATSSGPAAAQLIDLFGTAALPTAFTSAMPAADVQRRVQALNPRETVIMGATG
jgi:hypothetical protein|tara:strand:+ start:588 stop:788 length:201 start_codon:yes stop_codon:yes gene_type:complete